MSDEQQEPRETTQMSELQREERRLERLRLVSSRSWPTPVRFNEDESEPDKAA
jgi:hypothetical protein